MAIYGRGAGRGNFRAARQAAPMRETSPVRSQSSRISVEEQAQRLANEIILERENQRRLTRNGKIYSRFDTVDDVLANNIETVTRGLFFGNTGSLTNMFLNSNLTATQQTYYQEVFSGGDPATDNSARSEFSIAFGHAAGSGSADLTGNLNNDTPTRAIYKQYAQILLDPDDKRFTFDGDDSDSIYVLNFNRARVREKLDPGNFELTLAQLSGSGVGGGIVSVPNNTHTGSAVTLAGTGKYIQIIDDSSLTSATVGEAGEVYNLVSGSLDGGTNIHNSSDPVVYGLLYPQHGVAILNGNKLDLDYSGGGVNFNTVTGSGVQGENAKKLFVALSSSNDLTPASVNGGVQARSAEAVKSTYYFVRAKNAEYNYSNNPSYVTGSLGQLTYNSFKSDPQTYITSVGLYNDRRELLAVAKLSQPLLKNFTREALIKVKLDF
jgi:hypothetical protein